MAESDHRTPVPDPTSLTTAAVNDLRTEMATLFDEKLARVGDRIGALQELMEVQKTASDLAITKTEGLVDRLLQGQERRISELREIAQRLETRQETRRESTGDRREIWGLGGIIVGTIIAGAALILAWN